MSNALVIIEPGQDAASLLALVAPVADTVAVAVLAGPGGSASAVAGAASTTVLQADGLQAGEAAAAVVAELVASHGAELVALPATARFREVAALLTGRLDAACAPDAIALARTADGLTADRLLYGGVVIGTFALQRPVAVVTATVKPLADGAAPAGGPAPARAVTAAPVAGKTLTGRAEVAAEGGLANAERIVSFGRGLRAAGDIELIRALAAALDAELGCSRPIVDDLKWLGLPHQVGLTGTTVKPRLYLAVGISGQIQHLVGMRDAKTIIAINNNPSAPIFEASDLAVVGDLYEIVPRLTAALAARSA
ncbi:MAG: electron transfer flavoprotein subunit alpha/FixB family protein [Actinomycetia bacterium]|nr:electron transfer flavoprotein subunit alpha/FixB family protein [Actinomycetes bacterium]